MHLRRVIKHSTGPGEGRVVHVASRSTSWNSELVLAISV